jgi:hypothetical protein
VKRSWRLLRTGVQALESPERRGFGSLEYQQCRFMVSTWVNCSILLFATLPSRIWAAPGTLIPESDLCCESGEVGAAFLCNWAEAKLKQVL